jgi:tetratricopeptide (TPR) repeat protein
MRTTLSGAVILANTFWLTGCHGLSEQRQWLAEGEQAYRERQYDQAVQRLTLVVNAAPDRPVGERALYVRALAHLRAGRRLQARADLTNCLETASDADIRWRAFTVLGTIDYEDGQWASAARAYSVAADVAPRTPPTDVILFRLGLCHERSGHWSEARRPYQRIVSEFPGSELASAAARRLQINASCFAVQCGVFAQPQNAQRLAGDLQREGLSACVRTEPRAGGAVQVVLVGRFARYEEALHELARVKGYVPGAVLWP